MGGGRKNAAANGRKKKNDLRKSISQDLLLGGNWEG